MAWLDLTSFRFSHAQDRGKDKNLRRYHPDITVNILPPERFQRPLLRW